MKNKLLTIVFSLLIIPHAVLAAPLSDSQARSLIAVVQSSPETPAGAFTNLITAFSNITVKQAESLINVVKAAPGVAPDAFVVMLIAFTEDTQVDRVEVLETRVNVIEQQVSQPSVGGIIIPMEPNTIVVETLKQEPNNVLPFGRYHFIVRVENKGKYVGGQPISVEFPSDHDSQSPYGSEEIFSKVTHDDPLKVTSFGAYNPTSSGEKTVTFTSGDVVKTITVTVD